MSDGLDVIILDDEPTVCAMLEELVKQFHTWGEVISFTDVDKAVEHCLRRDNHIAVFVVDVFVGGKSGFDFLDEIAPTYVGAHSDTVMITGDANDDVVDMCVASDVHHLLEKPIKRYALQLAIRSVVAKYLKFARKIMQDEAFAAKVARV